MIDLCKNNPCSPNAECQSQNGLSFTCTCNNGYTGDGVGPNGCTAIPVSQPTTAGPSGQNTYDDGNSPVSESGPSGENSPASQNGPNSSPSASDSPKSNLVSSSCAVSIGFFVKCLVALVSGFVC